MLRTKSILFRALLLAVPLCAAFAVGAPRAAEAQTVVVVPPPEFEASAQPEYFEGHPAYWYHNSWYYRDEHHAWNYYRSEPAYLRDRRAHWGADHDRGGRYHYHR